MIWLVSRCQSRAWGHIFHRPIPAGLALHCCKQAVEVLYEGAGQPSSGAGHDFLQMPFCYLGDTGYQFERFSGLSLFLSHRGALPP
jgi:hypothetical protein